MKKVEILDVVRHFKRSLRQSDVAVTNEAIKHFKNAITYNGWKHEIHSLSDIDIIFKLPSQFSANDRTFEVFHSMLPNVPAFRDSFVKKSSENIMINYEKIASEASLLTPECVERRVKTFRTHYHGRPFEVKHLAARLRRYIYNFMDFQLENGVELIKGKNVLLLDDTIGEGVTLREASRVIHQFQPKSIIGFSVLRDYRVTYNA